MFRMNGMPRAQGCAGEAKHIHVPLGRDTAQAALSTGIQSHLVHVAHGPEVRYRTPSALCKIID
jgi:hypothetical protein